MATPTGLQVDQEEGAEGGEVGRTGKEAGRQGPAQSFLFNSSIQPMHSGDTAVNTVER